MSRDDNNPLLTAVIPVGPVDGKIQPLRATLESCGKLPVQVILVCDDYNDGTWEVLTKLVDEVGGRRVVLLRDNYGGPGPARNAGKALVVSPWVTFWDADDSPSPERILSELSNQENSDTTVVCGNYSVLDIKSNLTIYQSHKRQKLEENLNALGTQPGLWRMVFSQKLVKKCDFIDSRMGEDQQFIIQVLNLAPDIQFVESNFYSYSVGVVGQLTSTEFKNFSLLSSIELSQEILSTKENPWFNVQLLMILQMELVILARAGILQKIQSFSRLLNIIVKKRSALAVTRNILIIVRERKFRNEKK